MSDDLTTKMFPLQFSINDQRKMGGQQYHRSIPWVVAMKVYQAYCDAGARRGQTLEELAERGGFTHGEMDLFHPGWREEVDAIPLLHARIADLERQLAEARSEAAEAKLDAPSEETRKLHDDHFHEVVRLRVELAEARKVVSEEALIGLIAHVITPSKDRDAIRLARGTARQILSTVYAPITAATIERCARVCEQLSDQQVPLGNLVEADILCRCAAAIRALAAKE